ncbi:N-acetylmuramoyl-L-alanine amidase [Arthrobacter agilis]|uniref:N-acetylmuramoyl-L-alanine amidase n=1 Tax=Arthrobacter agilis TaxID=37921 RepID=UPI00278B1013|nr:N-acetylmuramoyl-L-alanine amidase [Arthrobacter agilis]MDQ0735165.1 hypothetical protein [Arthrobacter agilis]
MTYTIDESLSDSEFTDSLSVLGTFGTPRRIESITIHHWGSFGQTHDGVVDFFVHRNPNTSAHFVVSDGRIHCLVSPVNASWAAGNAYGNATSIHIECRPEATNGDYATVAWPARALRREPSAHQAFVLVRDSMPRGVGSCPRGSRVSGAVRPRAGTPDHGAARRLREAGCQRSVRAG